MPSNPKICHKYDVKQSLGNHVLSDPPNQTNPTIATQTDGQYNVWRCWVENQAILGNAKKARKQIVNEAMMIPVLAHLPRDQIRHHLDSKKAVMCERDLRQTEKVPK